MAERYIWIPRWEEFQHYAPRRDRGPAWVKAYTAQLDDDRYLKLTGPQRALLHDVRFMFASMRLRVPYDVASITARRRERTRKDMLESLNHAGFIDIISRTTLDRRLEEVYASRARARGREEVDKEGEEDKRPLAAASPATSAAEPQTQTSTEASYAAPPNTNGNHIGRTAAAEQAIDYDRSRDAGTVDTRSASSAAASDDRSHRSGPDPQTTDASDHDSRTTSSRSDAQPSARVGSQLPGVEPEAPREHEIRDAAQRFGADHDIVERYAQLLDRNTFHGVTERAQARINAGTARDTPALFVEILKRAVVGQAREDVRAAAAAPPTVDEQVVLEARDYARMRTPWDAARPLLERALRRRGIHDNDELERLLAAAEDAYRNDEAAAATGHNP